MSGQTREVKDSVLARRDLIARELAAGLTPAQIREKHSIDRTTMWRDMLEIKGLLREGFAASAQQWRTEQLVELADLRSLLVDPSLSKSKKVELTLKIIDMEAELTGSKAPTKSVTAAVGGGVKGLDQCPVCGSFLDPETGETKPMKVQMEWLVVDPQAAPEVLPPLPDGMRQLPDGMGRQEEESVDAALARFHAQEQEGK